MVGEGKAAWSCSPGGSLARAAFLAKVSWFPDNGQLSALQLSLFPSLSREEAPQGELHRLVRDRP
jgi:hypothetical protein